MGKKKQYDENLVSNWPMIRVHPDHYAEIEYLAERQGTTTNNMLYQLLAAVIKNLGESS